MSLTMWIVSGVGFLGVAGTIAAVIMVPAVAVPILQSIVSAILRCKPCLIALSILAALFTGALYGAHVEKAKCRAGELAAKLRNAQIDVENAEKAAKDESNRAKSIEDAASARQKADADYIAKLKGNPACNLDDSDLGRMRDKSRASRKNAPSSTK